MARQPVQNIPLSSQLTPQAKPIDTYVRPSGRNSLHDLADALGSMNNSLQSFVATRDQKQEQDDMLMGRAAFLSKHEPEFAQAVSSGKIPAQYSPFYVKGFKEAQGAASGDSLRSLWSDAWDKWDGKNNEDPQAFDQFFSGFVKDNLKTQDP